MHEGLPDKHKPSSANRGVLNEVVRLVANHAIDILALQEVDYSPKGESPILAALASGTQLGYIAQATLSASALTPGRFSGLAVASSYPIVASQFHMLPNPNLRVERDGQMMQTFDKGVLACTIDIDGTFISMTSVHGYPFHRFARDASEPEFNSVWGTLARVLSASGTRPFIVGGDFNTAVRSLVVDRASSKLRRAVGEVPTHRGLAIDDILYSAGLVSSGRAMVIPNFSDHHLCVADLKVIQNGGKTTDADSGQSTVATRASTIS